MPVPPTFVVNVEAAVYHDGEYLLAERAPTEDHAAGDLALVGGKVEEDDPVQDVFESTVRRELDEEVGITVSKVVYVTSSVFESDTGDSVLNVVFLGTGVEGTPRPREPDEVVSLTWRTPELIAQDDDIPAYTRSYVAAAESCRQRRL